MKCRYCGTKLIQMTIHNETSSVEMRFVCEACGYPFYDE